jgi:hypothetical protein
MTDVLSLIDAYARTRLIEHQQYRRTCLLDDTLELEQIHSIYDASVFQGYAFQYRFADGERLESLVKLNSLGASLLRRVKRFEVRKKLASRSRENTGLRK